MEKDIRFDPQYMDMNYSRWYLVPWPDCQMFDEMDEFREGTHPTWIDGQPATFVDPEWLFKEE